MKKVTKLVFHNLLIVNRKVPQKCLNLGQEIQAGKIASTNFDSGWRPPPFFGQSQNIS